MNFSGQSQLIRRILSRIGAERPQSVAVIGGPKSGKTSLLEHLVTLRESVPGDRMFILMKGRDESLAGPEGFLRKCADLIPLGESLPPSLGVYELLKEKVEILGHQNRALVILLDDFHLITSSPVFPLEFYSFLRSLANNYNLAYVTTSRLELQKLCSHREIQESPFFNIFTNMHLGPLDRDGALSLLREAGVGEPAAAAVLVWTGALALPLNLAAGWLASRPSGSVPSQKDLEAELSPQLDSFYLEIVGIQGAEVLKPLRALAAGRQPPREDSYLFSSLIKQGLVTEGEAGLICNPALGHFIRKRLKRDSFGRDT